MGTSVGVGYSFHRNPEEAGREAAVNAMEQAGIEVPDFVFVFATVGYSQDILIGAIRKATSGAPLSGCSGEGIIAQDTVSESNFGVAVMAIKSDELRFNNAYATGIGHRSDIAGEHLAAETFRATFEKSIGRESPLPIFGGLSADNWSTQRTYQYHNAHVFSEGISCVIMSGNVNIAYGVNHGCIPVGTKRTITKSDGNVIYEIDGVPALEALKDYFEEGWQSQWNKISINLCLGFKTPENIRQNYEEYIIRYMITKNDRDGSVTIPCDAPAGAELWMVRRDSELIKSGLSELSRNIKEKIGTVKPKFVLHFECAGRGKVILRERVKIDLISSLQKEMGGDIPWIGFYGYGEIGPVAGYNCFHNFTSVVTVVY
jgi:hypothetical protein